MPIVQADRLTRIGAALLKAAGASDEEAHAVASGCVNANLAGHDSHGVIADPDLYRPHQGRPYRARREMDHRPGIADHDRDRRPLGLRLPRQRQGDGADHRQGQDRQCRGLHRVPPEPCRPARALSADGDARGHDRASPPPIPAARPNTSRRSAAARRGSAPTRSRSRCPPISKRRSISTWRPRPSRPARSRSRSRARKRSRPAGSSTPRAGTPPIPPNIARAARCCRSAAPRATRAAGLAAMVEVLCGLLTGLGFGVEPTGRHNDGMLHGGVQRRRVPPAARNSRRKSPSSRAI